MKNLLLTLLAILGIVSLLWVGVVLLRTSDTAPATGPSDPQATQPALFTQSNTRPATTQATDPGTPRAWLGLSASAIRDRLDAIRGQDNAPVIRGRPGYWRLERVPARPAARGADVKGTAAGGAKGSGSGGGGAVGGVAEAAVWWFLSPEGKREWMNTVTTVQPFQIARDPKGPHYISKDYDGGLTENGNVRAWAEKTLVRVRDAGFKGLGAWCNPVFHNLDVPITRDLNLWKWVSGDKNTVLLFSPDWARLAEVGVREQVVKYRTNKNLVGYYIDNELEWGDGLVGPRIYFDGHALDDPNRLEVLKVVKEVWPSLEDFNRDWGTALTSYAELERMSALPLSFSGGGRAGNYAAYIRLLNVWMEHAAREYFRITTTLIRRYDPNHLILGVRFKNWAPEEIVRASRGYTDAQSLNSYVGDARLDKDMYEMMHRESGGQPVIITEYSFHALDGRSGNRNTVGFAAQVVDQRARAEGYRLFTSRLARVPFVIGADWFQWSDEPPSGRYDGEDVNFGIVDVDDRAYEPLVRAVRETAAKLNDLHAASARPEDPDSDIWRESYAVRPTTQVPYLRTEPRLNGELSDWPLAARVIGVRAGKTLGLERSRVPIPNVYLGWRDEGLYLAFEVFDDDIQGADPKGSWWTRDCVEWWISTRAVDAKQSWYDGSCHQFFFVPREFPDGSSFGGASGVVGRWHRPGDAVKDNLIPEPNVRVSSRVLPGRYVAEMLIPRESLAAWDPTREPRINFNFHARNWQHATDYFWSAPKEMQTQLRPGTWGTAYLLPPTR